MPTSPSLYMLTNFIHNLKGKIVEELNFSCIRGAPSDLREGGRTVFLCRIIFSCLWAARFFLANAGISLSGRLFA